MSNKGLSYIILTGLFVIPFVPLIVSNSLLFPFITGKAFLFRLTVEIIFAVWVILAMRDQSYRPKFSWILASIVLFLIVIGIADILSENPFKSFWSNYERMEGYIMLLHLGGYFLVLGSVFKRQETWNKLFATSLIASLIVSIYSFLQLVGKIPINQGGVRVDGTFGNASYLAIYMVFHVFIATLLFFRAKYNWQKILLAIVAVLALLTLYFTATKGAILGLVGGAFAGFVFLAFKSEKGSRVRKIAAGGVIILILFIGSFLAAKDTSFVRSSPVLSRFSSVSLSEIKTQGRYYVWPMAIKGFLERPILGWGQESFNFIFNKYYDPRMYYHENWFDRAHNTPLDWLIAGGTLGFLSYVSIFLALFFYILKSQNENFSSNDKAIIFSLILAYCFNNLFVFDQIGSYVLFFTVAAYVHWHAPETAFPLWDKISSRVRIFLDSGKSKPLTEVVILILFFVTVYSFTYSPWRMNRELYEVLKTANQGEVAALLTYAKPLSSYKMSFPEALENIYQVAIDSLSNPKASPELRQNLFDTVDKAFSRQIDVVPNDARYRFFYGIFLSKFGQYDRAITQLEEAQKLSPQKQQIMYELVSNYLHEGKVNEAVQTAKTAFELETSNWEARFVYGLTLLAAGDKSLSKEILSPIPEHDIVFDDRTLLTLLAVGKYPEIIGVVKRRIELDPHNIQHKITLTAAYLEASMKQEAIVTLEKLIRSEPSFKEKGEYYISEIKAGRRP